MRQQENAMNTLIEQIARMNHTTPEEVLKEMQMALDSAFETDDPEVKNRQKSLFGDSKPTAEEFIERIAKITADSEEK